jgi:cytochrome c-type biogenesis protein CcmH/NrfG
MDSTSQIIEIASNIQWLLVAVVTIGIILLVLIALAVWALFKGGSILLEHQQDKVFRVFSENHLSKNENDELITYCNERLETHPNDVWAHWYLGQAQFHTNMFHESKRSFERVLELEPSWYSSIDSWIEKISDKLDDSRPKLVD